MTKDTELINSVICAISNHADNVFHFETISLPNNVDVLTLILFEVPIIQTTYYLGSIEKSPNIDLYIMRIDKLERITVENFELPNCIALAFDEEKSKIPCPNCHGSGDDHDVDPAHCPSGIGICRKCGGDGMIFPPNFTYT